MALEQDGSFTYNPLQIIYNGIIEREDYTTVYTSPFQIFNGNPSEFSSYRNLMDCNSSAQQIFVELKEALIGSHKYLPAIPLHPPRLLRAVIDWKINHPEQEMERFVEQAIQVGLAVYRQQAGVLDMVDDFEEEIASNIPELLGTRVHQEKDLVTWCATQPDLSYNSARYLAFQHVGKDMLFIALGHGGVAAGMDVLLRYVDNTGSANSVFYTTRFSRRKKYDDKPQLSAQEAESLKKLAGNRKIVLFDEDTTSGITLEKARLFYRNLFQTNDITLRTNSGRGYLNDHL